jgi:phosphopantetheine adenylyltransferase
MNWIASEIGEYPFTSVSNNLEIVNSTGVKAIKDFDFDLKDITKENITPAVKDKFNLKQ